MNKIEMRVLKTDVTVTTPEGTEAVVTIKQLQWRETIDKPAAKPATDYLIPVLAPPEQQWSDWQTVPEVYEHEVYEDRETEMELAERNL